MTDAIGGQVIGSNRRPSEVIRRNRRPSEVIGSHQNPSEPIREARQSEVVREAINGHHRQSKVIRGK